MSVVGQNEEKLKEVCKMAWTIKQVDNGDYFGEEGNFKISRSFFSQKLNVSYRPQNGNWTKLTKSSFYKPIYWVDEEGEFVVIRFLHGDNSHELHSMVLAFYIPSEQPAQFAYISADVFEFDENVSPYETFSRHGKGGGVGG